MTAFATLPDLPSLSDLPELPELDAPARPDSIAHLPKPLRAAVVDHHVARNRAVSPIVGQTDRATKRLSIAELNQLDPEDLHQRFAATRLDDRGPLTRFIDLIDLPRNTIAHLIGSVITPQKVDELSAKGETAAFGQTRVNFSDILDGMGVHNQVIRGVVGLVGDVALDPLTYAGGAAIKGILGVGGKAASFTGASMKAMKAASAAHDAGLGLAEVERLAPGVGKYLEAAQTPAGKAGEALFGAVKSKKRGWTGFLKEDRAGSALADDIWNPITQAEVGTADETRKLAAQELYKTHGRAYGPGIRLSADGITMSRAVPKGTGLLHVPLTDFELTVPAFSARAKGAVASTALGKDAYTTWQHPLAKEMTAAAERIDGLSAMMKPENYEKIRAAHAANPELEPSVREAIEYTTQALKENADQLAATMQKFNADPLAKAADIAHAQNVFEAYVANAAKLTKQAEAEGSLHAGNAELWERTRTDLQGYVDKRLAAIKQEHDAAMEVRKAARADRDSWIAAQEQTHAARTPNVPFNAAQAERDYHMLRGTKPADLKDLPFYTSEQAAKAREAVESGNKNAAHNRKQLEKFLQDEQANRGIAYNEADSTDDWLRQTGAKAEDLLDTPHDTRVPAEIRAAEEAGIEYRQNLHPDQAAVIDLTPEQIDMRAKYINTLQAQGSLAHDIANYAKAPVTASLGSRSSALRDFTEITMGLGDSQLGTSLISGMGSVARNVMGDKMNTVLGDKTMRALTMFGSFAARTLGSPGGVVNNMVRDTVKAMKVASSPAAKNVFDGMERAVRDAVGAEHAADAMALITDVLSAGQTPLKHIRADDAAAESVRAAMSGGLLDKTSELGRMRAEALQGIIAEARKHLDEMGLADGMKIEPERPYFPNTTTQEATARARHAKVNTEAIGPAPAQGSGPSLAAEMEPGYLKHRSTIEREWTDAEGVKHAFMEGDRFYQSILGNPEYRRLLDPKELAYAEKKAAEIDLWDKLSLKDQMNAAEYQLSPREINRRVERDGLFNVITQGPLDGKKFFDTRASSAIAIRTGQQERKYLGEYLQTALKPHALAARDVKLGGPEKSTFGGNTLEGFRTQGGAIGRLYSADGTNFLEVGNETYRKLKKTETAMQDNPIPREAMVNWYPTKIADILDDKAGILTKGSLEGMLPPLEEIAKLWKVATLSHPSWTINDVIGNLFYALNAGIGPKEITKHAKFTMAALLAHARGDTEALHNLTTTVSGRTMSAYDLIHGEGRQILTNSTAAEAMATTTGDTLTHDKTITGPIKDLMRGRVGEAAQGLKDAAKESWANGQARAKAGAAQGNLGTLSLMQQLSGIYKGAVDEGILRRVWSPWAKANGIANDWVRASAFMAMLDRGHDAASAARHINENMLDMGMATSFDKSARQLIPFWTWMKNSGVYGIKQLVQNPKFFSITPHLKRAVEEAANGDANLPQSARPSWLRDQLAIQIGTDPATRHAFTLTSSLPFEAASYAAGAATGGWPGVQSAVGYGVNSLSPILKAPIEIAGGKEFFTGRSIGTDTGDVTIPEYLLGQIRPLKELGIGQVRGGPIQRAFQDGLLPGASRVLLGGRLQPFDEPRRIQNLQREGDDKALAIRRRINVAERENAKGESVIQRAKLLRLYADMRLKGLKVPKWAEKQVESASR